MSDCFFHFYIIGNFFFFKFRLSQATKSFKTLKRSLYRQRARLASIPPNIIDVPSIIDTFSRSDNMDKFGKTVSGNTFYKTAYSCMEFSYCVFASDDIIKMFQQGIPAESRNFLMDATFKSCPLGIFNQILIIYISYLDSVIFFLKCSH